MIDKNGQKIIGDKDKYDSEFALKEIKFFFKGFLSQPDDKKAYSISKMIHQYVKNTKQYEPVAEYMKELEDYAHVTRNDDFVWHLVYIRRLQADVLKAGGKADYNEIFEAKYAAAKHFENICKIYPSKFNNRARASEYMSAAIVLHNAGCFSKISEKLKEICVYVEELFKDLVPEGKDVYYDTGRLLYYFKFYYAANSIQGKDSECIENLNKAIYYSLEGFALDKTNDFYVRQIAMFFELGIKYKGFVCDDNIKKLEDLCREVSVIAKESGSPFTDALSRLEAVRKKAVEIMEKSKK